jgi:hypothetical protein
VDPSPPTQKGAMIILSIVFNCNNNVPSVKHCTKKDCFARSE